MQINDYNEHNKFEESLNKDNDHKENKICINKFIKHKSEKLNIKGIFLITLIVLNYTSIKKDSPLAFLKPFERYINECKHARRLQRTKVYNDHPYISVCLAAFNL